jgi:hypothetical protein
MANWCSRETEKVFGENQEKVISGTDLFVVETLSEQVCHNHTFTSVIAGITTAHACDNECTAQILKGLYSTTTTKLLIDRLDRVSFLWIW